MNNYFLKLCWKNLWRNKRRSLLAVNAIAIGVTWLVFVHNYHDALTEQFIGNAIRYRTGHLTVSKERYHEHRETKYFIKDHTEVSEWLSSRDEVKATSPTVNLQGMLSAPRGSATIWFIGVDPEAHRKAAHYAEQIIEGSYFDNENPRKRSIVIGLGLKERLGLRLGSKVVALTQGVDGSIGNELFHVTGVYDTKSEADSSVAFIQIGEARSLLSLPENGAHQVSVILKNETELAGLTAATKLKFSGRGWEFPTWRELQHQLMGTIELYKNANKLLMWIILLIASVGISNSILMGLMERTREFGVMMAMGTSRMQLVGMAWLETLLLSGVGVALGNLLGLAMTAYFGQTGFDLQWLTSGQLSMHGTLIETVSYPQIDPAHCLTVSSHVLILCSIAALIPIQHIAKLRAVKALRSI